MFARRTAVTLLRVATVAAVTAGSAARAEPTLVWDAPTGCPTAAAVLGNVRRMLVNAGSSRVPIAATTHVVPAAERWQASLVLEVAGIRTERRLEAESCDAIAAAAAVIIAVAAEGEPDAPVAPRPTPKPRQAPIGPRALLMVSGVADWRTLPVPPSAGVEAAGGWSTPLSEWWRAGFFGGASFFPARELPVSSADVFGDWWLVNVLARGCLSATASVVDLGVCAGAEMAIMHASNPSPTASSPDTLPAETEAWLAVSAGGIVGVRLPASLALVLRAEVVVPTERPSFGTRSGSASIPLYRVPATAFRGALGIGWGF